jgi:hypothetical protein
MKTTEDQAGAKAWRSRLLVVSQDTCLRFRDVFKVLGVRFNYPKTLTLVCTYVVADMKQSVVELSVGA